jgi:DNA-binding MurR/RpiR family transcriptional regulator
MARLLEGRPDRTEGALTVANLARKAGVSRATANRAADLLAEFRAAEVNHRRSSPQAMKQRIRALEAELRAVRGAEMAELRALSREVSVIPLRRSSRDGAG